MADQKIVYTEEMVGSGHPTKADTLNRLALIEHNNDGTHKSANIYTDLISKSPVIDVRAYGAVGDGVTDDTAAFQAAADFSKTVKNRPLFVPCLTYKITGVVTFGQGTMVICAGSQGSTGDYGTTFRHFSNGNMFVWDGSGTLYAGTGGGLKNALILKATGYSGGDAIKLLATNDNQRPGEMVLDNLLAYGEGTGLWARGINIDGTACVTAGSKGVRSVIMNKVRVSDCTTNDEYIVVNQGVHVSGTHVQIDTGDGTGTCGMTVKGDSENVNLSNLILNGNLNISGNATHVNIHGRVSALDVSNTACIGTADISTASQILNASKFFKIAASNKKPSFYAKRAAAVANVTGDNTNYTVLYDSEVFDNNGDFNPATGKFTATCAGVYTFSGVIVYYNLGAAHTRTDGALLHTDSAGTVLSSIAVVSNPYAQSAAGNYSQSFSCTLELAKGDRVSLIANVSGSTLTVGVYGAAATVYTYLSGSLI